MAQIVCIDTGTLRDGINRIGDVVAIHDDDVLLGPSYSGFKILSVPGTAQEVEALMRAKLPEVKPVFRSQAGAGEWTDERPEEKEAWNDAGTWREVTERPKYQANLAITKELEGAVSDTAMTDGGKLSLIGAAVSANLATANASTTEIKIATVAVKAEAEIA